MGDVGGRGEAIRALGIPETRVKSALDRIFPDRRSVLLDGAMATALFEQAAGIEMELTPYQGIAPAQVDLAGGRLDLIITTLA